MVEDHLSLRQGDIIHIIKDSVAFKHLVGNTYEVRGMRGTPYVIHNGKSVSLGSSTKFNKVGA